MTTSEHAGRPPLPGPNQKPAREREQREPDVGPALRVVPRPGVELHRQRLRPATAEPRDRCGHDVIERIGRVHPRGRVPVERGRGPQAADRLVEERAQHERSRTPGHEQLRHRRPDGVATSRHQPERHQQRREAEDQTGEEHLRRDQDLEREDRGHQDHEAAHADRLVHAQKHQLHRGRQQEHRHEVQMPEHLPQFVRGEAVHVPADQRGKPRTGYVAAEPVPEPGAQDRRQQGREVVGDDHPTGLGHWPQGETERGDARRRREVDLGRVPDRAREERIGCVGDRVRPPLERPHEEAGVAAPQASAGVRRVRYRMTPDQGE